MSRIGFIGLGIMGEPMCRNLLKAGHRVTFFNRSKAPMERLAVDGAVLAVSIGDVGSQAEIVITMLPDGPEVEQVTLGPGGVLEQMQAGACMIDMSSINPLVSRRIGTACTAKGVRFLDAPVSGGEPKAIDGTLAIMVGGDAATFNELLPVLRAMGSSVRLTGSVGAGNTTKLANQIIVACNIAAMGEALVLAVRAGLDPNVVVHATQGGLAGSAVLNAKAPKVIHRTFMPGFRIRLHQKDLRNALQAAESMEIKLPLTSMVQQMVTALVDQGKGDLDHAAIVTFVEQITGLEISGEAEKRN